ncbi:tetratricopeptide repeat protein [Xanthomonadaceae bacterium XH05]|nr:tetratricopeptide repeat protein [Xanthomonadaceae bacterium XH05]
MPLNESAPRYRAFLSYSHHDEAVVRVLHRKLETFRVPRALRDAHGKALPARLAPVFRDRDELASSSQLSHSIETALDESEALVVVCSPASAGSAYVNDEIAWFRRNHPERPVLAFVVAGDPGADPRMQVDPDATPQDRQPAFPLMLALADAGAPDGALGEPLAADARPQGDGFDSALLKLVAGLLGVRYDELRRREHKRRQRVLALVSVASLLLATVFAALAWQATRARDIARAAQAQAELELTSERQTREFLISVFELADANQTRGESVTVREVLDRAVQRIDRSEFARPAIRARFLATMGQAYGSLGMNRRSAEMLRQSIAAASGENGDIETLRQHIDSGVLLAAILRDMGDYEGALQALDAAEQLGVADALQTAALANMRGEVLTEQERDDDARASFKVAERLLRALPESKLRMQELGKTRIGLATLALYAGDAAAALTMFDEALPELEHALGPDHPLVIEALGTKGSAAYRNHQTEAAREAWERALQLAQRVFDPDNPQIGTFKNNLGLLLFEEGDFDAAEPLLRATLESDRRHRNADYEGLAFPLYNLGFLLRMRGDADASHDLWREGVDIAQAHSHRMLGPLLAALGDWECELGSAETGLPLAQRAVKVLEAASEADAWRVSQARLSLAFCRARNGEHITRQQMTADMDELRQRWPNPANPFRQRAQSQFQTLSRP